jgi:hypothetical protein
MMKWGLTAWGDDFLDSNLQDPQHERPVRVNAADKPAPWKNIRCASMPVDDLGVLADLRGRADIRVAVAGGRAWIGWGSDSEVVPELLAGRILPIEGVELFIERDGEWYRLGEHLPAFGVPFRNGTAGVSLDRIVIPGRLSVLRPGRAEGEPLCVRLVRDREERVRPASALTSSYEVFLRWAEGATSAQIGPLQIVSRVESDGDDGGAEVLVLGSPGTLPPLALSVRYWGVGVLIPLGFRAEPDLPEAAIRQAAGAGVGDLVVMDEDRLELIARELFKPLTRAGIRLGRPSSTGVSQDGGGLI